MLKISLKFLYEALVNFQNSKTYILWHICRSSRPTVFCNNKDALRNLAKFIGKHLCQNLLFNKVAGLRPATLLKKRLWYRCFLVNIVKFLRTPFFPERRPTIASASGNNIYLFKVRANSPFVYMILCKLTSYILVIDTFSQYQPIFSYLILDNSVTT